VQISDYGRASSENSSGSGRRGLCAVPRPAAGCLPGRCRGRPARLFPVAAGTGRSMRIKNFLKRSHAIRGLVTDYRLLRRLWVNPKTKKAVGEYLNSVEVAKLQLGGGGGASENWLITDLVPQTSSIVYLNVAGPFPIPDQSFDYIACEHLIEHLDWFDGQNMLRECFRVLKPEGRIRIATPDLEMILGLYTKKDTRDKIDYMNYLNKRFPLLCPEPKPAFAVNCMVRSWGHQFIYDRRTLEVAMAEAGFVNCRMQKVGESEDPNLRGLEQRDNDPNSKRQNAFETFVLEANRPQSHVNQA